MLDRSTRDTAKEWGLQIGEAELTEAEMADARLERVAAGNPTVEDVDYFIQPQLVVDSKGEQVQTSKYACEDDDSATQVSCGNCGNLEERCQECRDLSKQVARARQKHVLKQRSALIKGGIWSHVATLEHHYYHMDEVWHALYSRAEKRHLMDPENEDFNDDEQQKRQQKLFKGIMDGTGNELRRQIDASIHVDTSVSVVKEPYHLSPQHIYSAMRVQEMIKAKNLRRALRYRVAEKKEMERKKGSPRSQSPEGGHIGMPADGGTLLDRHASMSEPRDSGDNGLRQRRVGPESATVAS